MVINSSDCCVLLGGGGHARVLLEVLSLQPQYRVIGILDAKRELWNQTVHGISILGDERLLPSLRQQGISHFAVAVGSVGSTLRRQQAFNRALQLGLIPVDVIHPTSLVSASASINPGCQLLPYSVVNAGARLGCNVLLNTRAIVEHDCRLGDHVHVASGAILCGAVRVGAGTHIGAGAVVRQQINIGKNAVIGAGAVVVDDIPDDTTVAGVPARPLLDPLTVDTLGK